jgi:hypothetical protein
MVKLSGAPLPGPARGLRRYDGALRLTWAWSLPLIETGLMTFPHVSDKCVIFYTLWDFWLWR